MVQLNWTRAMGGAWCDLHRVNVGHIDAAGVFVVWHGGQRPRTLRVGAGPIGERVGALQRDESLMRYRNAGPIFVTWAQVPPGISDGVMRFLAGRLMPVFEDRPSRSPAIPANLPA